MEGYIRKKDPANESGMVLLESQREYREQLSAFIQMHIARANALENGVPQASLPVNSMLIVAQTGCGKSFTAARLCEAAGVELVTIDCSVLSKSGYKGCNLGELLYTCSNGKDYRDVIILFDEVDKMRLDSADGNPQPNFLKLFEGVVQAEPRGGSPVNIDVSRASFLFAGAFHGLDQIIRRRKAPRSIGFTPDRTKEKEVDDPLALATMEDIREYGFLDELLGRIGTLLYVPPLTPGDYRMLIKGGSGSVQGRYANLLNTMGVSLSISDSACEQIARKAAEQATGARSVDPLIRSWVQKAFAKVGRDESINRVTLTCREGELVLRYGRGARGRKGPPREKGEEEPELSFPDVNIAEHLKDDAGISYVCMLCLQAYHRPNTKQEWTLKVFLRCCLYLMATLGRDEDKTLNSITKLADTTKPDGKENSCFERVVDARIKHAFDDEEMNEGFQSAYEAFCDYRNEENHRFWVEATRIVRRNWYKNLMEQAG